MSSVTTYVDMMIQIGLCSNQPTRCTTNDSGVKCCIYANASSNLVVYHGVAAADGTLLSNTVDVTTQRINPTNWFRLTTIFDATETNTANALTLFQVRINGAPITNTAAYADNWKAQYDLNGLLPLTCASGTWFRLATTNATAKRLTDISFFGRGTVDDLVAGTSLSDISSVFSGTFVLTVVNDCNGLSSLASTPYAAVTVAVGTTTQIVYTAKDWYRISTLTVNDALIVAASGVPAFTQTLVNIAVNISNNVSFALASPSQTGFTNVPTSWLTNWPETQVRSRLDAYDVPTKYLLGLDPTVSNTYIQMCG